VPGAPNAGVMGPSGATITPSGTIWYVRTDGGTAAQCNGKTDHALAGASGQNCAFSNPTYLWANDVAGETAQWKIAGGDTVILRQGPYRIGYKNNTGAASDAWGYCAGNNGGCTMPPIPAGTANQHTKFLGENYANCSTKTQLHGGYGLNHIIDVTQTQHVDVACLELTDHASCSRVGVGNICNKSFPGWDDYADLGIITDIASNDINFTDLDLHGLGSAAIQGPIGATVNVDHVRMHANGDAGWNFDDGNDDPMAPGAIVNAKYLVVEYSGCTEEYPIVNPNPVGICYDQAAGGWAYGDGVGTSDTTLSFTCDHCNFNHNTQDGFDLLHTHASVISITNSLSYANEGQQFKLGPMAQVSFINNVVIGNCHRMAAAIPGTTPGYNSGLNDNGSDLTDSHGLCRADGTPMSINMSSTGTYIIENNTVVSYGDIQWGVTCIDSSGNGADCSSANITFENNITSAYSYPSGIFPKNPVSLYFENGTPGSGFKSRSNNIFYNARSSICPTGFANENCTSDPLFVSAPNPLATYTDDTIFDNMNLHLQSGSPAKSAGISIPGLTLDWESIAYGNPPNMGAY
jgi:hypothetical protein